MRERFKSISVSNNLTLYSFVIDKHREQKCFFEKKASMDLTLMSCVKNKLTEESMPKK